MVSFSSLASRQRTAPGSCILILLLLLSCAFICSGQNSSATTPSIADASTNATTNEDTLVDSDIGCFEFRDISCNVSLLAGDTSFDINQACLVMENTIRTYYGSPVQLVSTAADARYHQEAFSRFTLSSSMCYAVQQAYHKCWWCAQNVSDDFCEFRSSCVVERELPEGFDLDTTCAQMNELYELYDGLGYPATIEFCQRAELASFECPVFCEKAYLGADTKQKKKVLVWMSRVAALLSLLGASFILYDVISNPKNRKTVYHRLLFGMACFDVITALAWGVATAPIPSENYWVYGANGSSATCSTQGFFIQLGFTSVFYNCSLSLYYLLVIVHGWKEHMLLDINPFLHGVPLCVGFVLAFAGIPIYDWYEYACHVVPPPTGEAWQIWVFAVIPLGISILSIMICMSSVYYQVRAKTQKSKKWSLGAVRGGSNALLSQVFYQSAWYVLSFLITWPILFAVYLASVDVGGPYGLTVVIAFVAPLQGFNNFLVYLRPKYNFWKRRRSSNLRKSGKSGSSKYAYTTSTSVSESDSGRSIGRLIQRSTRRLSTVLRRGNNGSFRHSKKSDSGLQSNGEKPEQAQSEWADGKTTTSEVPTERDTTLDPEQEDFIDPSVQIAAEESSNQQEVDQPQKIASNENDDALPIIEERPEEVIFDELVPEEEKNEETEDL